MSGKVNSAGSKSGVIGETELDYEEGDITNPAIMNDTTTITTYASNNSRYIKIGKQVTCYYNFDITNVPVANNLGVNLPFTPESRIGMTFQCKIYGGTTEGLWDLGSHYLHIAAGTPYGWTNKPHASTGVWTAMAYTINWRCLFYSFCSYNTA